jgi:hypothetical protein
MTLTPHQVYQQTTDCQRILVTGLGRDLVAKIVIEVLKFNNRKFSTVVDGLGAIHADSPVVIIHDKQAGNLAAYNHHILVLTAPVENSEASVLEPLLNATPKSGIILFPEGDAMLKSLASKERADVQAIAYKTIPHEEKNGQVTLVTSANEKFPIQLNGKKTLELLGSAKEVLKKIGISSGQFYRGVASIEA